MQQEVNTLFLRHLYFFNWKIIRFARLAPRKAPHKKGIDCALISDKSPSRFVASPTLP